jgi:putative ABC transport system permease protein
MRNLTLGDAQAILDEVPEIRGMTPNVDGTTVVASEARNWTTHWRGVSPDYFDIKRWTFAAGSSFLDEDVDRASNVVVLGETVRRELFDDESAIDKIVRIGAVPFRVVGQLAPKGQSGTGADQDDTLILPYTTTMSKIRGGGQLWLDDVLLSARAPEDIAAAASKIKILMRQRHKLGQEQDDDFNIRHPEELIQAQMAAQRTLEVLLVSLAAVSLLVGGIGVMNVMLASVAERTREIGLRLAVGAPDWAIEAQFLVEALLLGTIGGVAGVGASLLGATTIAHLLGWFVPVPPSAVALGVSASVLTGVAFGFWPALRAARLDPIEALRSE